MPTIQCFHRTHRIARSFPKPCSIPQFPVDSVDLENKRATVSPHTCLEPGWQTAGSVAEQLKYDKANTFMASSSRIDDERMYKIRPTGGGRYECAYYSTLERERMLGYPEGYVSGARE